MLTLLSAATAQVKNSFHVVLHHRLRALGRAEWVVFDNGRYRLDPAPGLEFDAARFETAATAALRDARGGADVAERLRSALALYRGELLQDEGAGDWHLEHRDRLRRLYVDAASTLGEQLMRDGAYTEAVQLFQRAEPV